jgi:hypothetical protein
MGPVIALVLELDVDVLLKKLSPKQWANYFSVIKHTFFGTL